MKSRIGQKSIAGIAPSIFVGGGSGSVVFIILASLILVFSLIKPQALSGFRVVATDVVTPVLSFFVTPFQNMAETVSSVSGIAALRAENAQLKTENVRLKEWYQTALMLQAENQSLQELLNLKVNPAHRYITSRVISDTDNAFIKTVLIASGSNDSIKKNQAVLAGEGLIGRIIEVGKKSSRILLMTDINSRIPIVIEGSRQKAILAGTNSDFLQIKHVPHDSSFTEGERVVTSGDGGVFPSGLPVGRIIKGKDGNFYVKAYADINKISYVRVIDAPETDRLIRGDLHVLSQ
jgi:rod shape-determining protein MreC